MRHLLFLIAVTSLARASTLLVPVQYSTIQAAIGASVAGDLILVAPGTYSGNLLFPNHQLVIRSQAGPLSTSLTATSGSVVTFQSGQDNATVLEGFAISGGLGTPVMLNGVQRGGVGGGVLCRNGSNPTIRGNWIHDNLAAWPAGVGGGIFAWSSHPLIEGNWIEHNTAHYGGGLFLQSSNARVLDNVIEGNATMPAQGGFSNGKGGGIRAIWGAPVVEGNTFVGNSCHWVGSAMAFSEAGTTVSIARNLLVGNQGNYPIDIAYSAHGNLACNLLWANSPSNSWPVAGYWSNLGGNGIGDPLFCDSAWPWRLQDSSPCRPGQNPWGASCGWIGASHEGCVVLDAQDEGPTALTLGEAWPNPFNPSCQVEVEVPGLMPLRLELRDLRGALVRTVHQGMVEAGRHRLVVDGGDLPSGLYLLSLESGSQRQVRKVTLIR